MKKSICIYTASNSVEADLIKAQLESSNIRCFLKSDDAGGVLPHLSLTNGIEVMVDTEQKEAAEMIIKGKE